jgi:hypothetical protein
MSSCLGLHLLWKSQSMLMPSVRKTTSSSGSCSARDVVTWFCCSWAEKRLHASARRYPKCWLKVFHLLFHLSLRLLSYTLTYRRFSKFYTIELKFLPHLVLITIRGHNIYISDSLSSSWWRFTRDFQTTQPSSNVRNTIQITARLRPCSCFWVLIVVRYKGFREFGYRLWIYIVSKPWHSWPPMGKSFIRNRVYS